LPTINIYINSSANDGEWFSNGDFDNYNTWANVGKTTSVRRASAFLRFTNVNIPQGATILNAYLVLPARYSNSSTTVNLKIYGNDVDNAVAPTSYSEAEALVLTSGVEWNNVGPWTQDSWYYSPSVVSIIQQIVNRAGWVSGNALMIIIKDNDSSGYAYRPIKTYDYDGVNRPRLTIEYTTDAIVEPDPFEASISLNYEPEDIIVDAEAFSASLTLEGEVPNNGSANITLPSLSVIAYGECRSGSLDAELPLSIICQASLAVRSGFLEEELPEISISAAGFAGEVARLDKSIKINLVANGFTGTIGTLEEETPALRLSSFGYTLVVGELLQSLPSFRIYAHSFKESAKYSVFAMNLNKFAVSEYSWALFKGFACINDTLYAISDDSIYEIGGDSDNGVPIDAEISLGNFLIDAVKPRDLYIGGRANGLMAIELISDEGQPSEVVASTMLEDLSVGRVKIPRGIRPSYFSFTIKNKNGADFELDQVQLFVERIERKHKK